MAYSNEDIIVQTVTAEVIHADCSQNVKGALAPPEQPDLSDSENTETANTETASEGHQDDGIAQTGSPPIDTPDSRPTPGQREVGAQNADDTHGDVVDTVSEMELPTDSQLGIDWSQLENSLSIDGGSKRDRKVLQSSAEEDSDGMVKIGTGSVVNSFFSRSKKKREDEDGIE